jgi:dynein heavy chain
LTFQLFALAAAGLCSWAVNIVSYYEVFCTVEPKRLALAQANAELAAAREKLRLITNKLAALEAENIVFVIIDQVIKESINL